MAIAPLFAGEGALSGTIMGFEAHAVAQAAYSVFFFLLAFTIALNPEKLTQRLGKILSPTLLTLIAVLFIAAIVHPLGEYGAVRAPYDLSLIHIEMCIRDSVMRACLHDVCLF